MELNENNVVFSRSLTKKNNSPGFLKIGRVTRVHGLKGEIFVSLFAPQKSLPSLVVGQFVQIKEDYEVKGASSHKQGMIIRLKGVEFKAQATPLIGYDFYAPKELFSSEQGEEIYLCEVLNFEVVDKTRGYLGKIQGFSDNGAQDLMLVQKEVSTKLEIPFIKEFLVHISFESQKIQVDLPLDWPGLDFST